MCGIAGIVSRSGSPIPDLRRRLDTMQARLRHRGPDGEGQFRSFQANVGLAHVRLKIIDLEGGHQPMNLPGTDWVTYNGEIYNYPELGFEIDSSLGRSDTRVLLAAYQKWRRHCVQRLRGMFAFAIWDTEARVLFCARDRFGIKPFYYTVVGDLFYFASEAKALLPFVPQIETDLDGLRDYLALQIPLAGKTLFKGIHELPPAHTLVVQNGQVTISRYWEVHYRPDFDHTAQYFEGQIRERFQESVALHLRSDVPVGAYVSGGFDSSLVADAAYRKGYTLDGFHGKFEGAGVAFDESAYARTLPDIKLHTLEILPTDFTKNISDVVYHLDHPVAGPGAFAQYMVSRLARDHVKVVLGGQGGDEIFGGYARYLIAYFEQCILGAIDGTSDQGNFIVTYESIIPNLTALAQYKPMLQDFWKEGLFGDLDARYFRLLSRAPAESPEVDWDALEDHGSYDPFDTFRSIFRAENVGKESYFDLMTHFDFKTLLPALLHVEDRMSMAHGLEARTPFLDHPLVELAATIPASIKFRNGRMKAVLKDAMRGVLPAKIENRTDKMGFPVPLVEWLRGPLAAWVHDMLGSRAARERGLIDNECVLDALVREPKYGRKIWGFLSLELWQQQFHDKQAEFRFKEHE